MFSLGEKLVEPEIAVMHIVLETRRKDPGDHCFQLLHHIGPKRVRIILCSHFLVVGLFHNSSLFGLVCPRGSEVLGWSH